MFEKNIKNKNKLTKIGWSIMTVTNGYIKYDDPYTVSWSTVLNDQSCHQLTVHFVQL